MIRIVCLCLLGVVAMLCLPDKSDAQYVGRGTFDRSRVNFNLNINRGVVIPRSAYISRSAAFIPSYGYRNVDRGAFIRRDYADRMAFIQRAPVYAPRVIEADPCDTVGIQQQIIRTQSIYSSGLNAHRGILRFPGQGIPRFPRY